MLGWWADLLAVLAVRPGAARGTSATSVTGPSKLLAIATSRPAASKTTDLPWPVERTSGTPVMTATHTADGECSCSISFQSLAGMASTPPVRATGRTRSLKLPS